MSTGVMRIEANPPDESFVYEDDIDAELLISGTPNHHGLTAMESVDGRAACGIWGCGVYKERIPSFPNDELFVVMEGRLVITVDGCEAETFSAGDAFAIRAGTPCVFDFQTPFKKFWMTYDPPPPGPHDSG